MPISFETLPMDLVLNILGIVVLFVILRAIVYKPVKKFLDERSGKIAEGLENAEKAKASLDEAKAQSDAIADEGRKAADEIIARGRADASAEAETILNNARAEAEKIVADAKASAAAERDEMVKTFKNEVTDLALDIAKKVLEKSTSDDDTLRIAEKFFDEARSE